MGNFKKTIKRAAGFAVGGLPGLAVAHKLTKDKKKKPVDPRRVRKPSASNVSNNATVFSSNPRAEEEDY